MFITVSYDVDNCNLSMIVLKIWENVVEFHIAWRVPVVALQILVAGYIRTTKEHTTSQWRGAVSCWVSIWRQLIGTITYVQVILLTDCIAVVGISVCFL